MIVKLNKSEKEKCEKLLKVKECNISAAEIYIDYLNNHYNDITKFDIELLSKKYDINTSFYKAFLKKLDIDEKDEEYIEINNVCHLSKIKKLDENEYLDDEYYKVIGKLNINDDRYKLATLKYLPFEGFTYDELDVDNSFYGERTPIGFFDKEFPYLALLENNTIWMSVVPHEINTMKKAIKDAKGSVLVLGLGLGYYVFNIAKKKEVNKITIIEKDKNIVNLFNKHLLNKFPHQEKINIIHADGIEYLGSTNNYDFVFVDIYHNVGDGEMLYLKVKDKERYHPNTTFSYWIEDSIVAMLRRQLLTIYEENLEGFKEEDYLKAKNENDKIINALYKLTKKYVVDSFESLHTLLEGENIKKIAKDVYKEINNE